jgi:hypothetical protein
VCDYMSYKPYTKHGMRHTQEYTMWHHCKRRAKRKDIPFDISVVDVVIPDICPLLDIPIMRDLGYVDDNTPSIDRIRGHLGYVKGNIWVISHKANRIKQDASLEELLLLCKNFQSLV